MGGIKYSVLVAESVASSADIWVIRICWQTSINLLIWASKEPRFLYNSADNTTLP
jgi:hypothetical protein